TERFFGRAGITMPTTQEFVDAGINFEDIATVYAQEKDAGHEPQLVITANGLPLEAWHRGYQALQDDPGVNTLGVDGAPRIRGGGLHVNDSIITHWSDLTDLSHLPGAGANSRVMTHQGIPWTIRIIPGTIYPTETSVDHAYKEAQHPTISDYLTMRAIRYELGEAPVDRLKEKASSFPYATWLAGDLANGACAPTGSSNNDGSQVHLLSTYRDLRPTTLGVRPVV
ncbi:MAG: hypothetical protein WAQ25_03515, partial [Candidatus Saccharimonas sp.]